MGSAVGSHCGLRHARSAYLHLQTYWSGFVLALIWHMDTDRHAEVTLEEVMMVLGDVIPSRS
jgi:hypothetical protein